MAPNHYATPGRPGLPGSPFCLGAKSFGRQWGRDTSASLPERMPALAWSGSPVNGVHADPLPIRPAGGAERY